MKPAVSAVFKRLKKMVIFIPFIFILLSAESPRPYISPVESPSKVIDGLEFSVVTQSEWRSTDPFMKVKVRIVLQLRITNRLDHPILFPTFDTYSVCLKTAEGVDMVLGGGRDKTFVTPNILLQPGSSYTQPIETTIEYTRDSQVAKLVMRDETGSTAWASLNAGRYTVFIKVFPTQYDFAKRAELPAPLWAGEGTTESVGFVLYGP